MIRGIGKRVVVLKNTDSELFEEAIFIIKNDNNKKRKDILIECEKIINSANPQYDIKRNKKLKLPLNLLAIIASISFTVFSILLLINLL